MVVSDANINEYQLTALVAYYGHHYSTFCYHRWERERGMKGAREGEGGREGGREGEGGRGREREGGREGEREGGQKGRREMYS